MRKTRYPAIYNLDTHTYMGLYGPRGTSFHENQINNSFPHFHAMKTFKLVFIAFPISIYTHLFSNRYLFRRIHYSLSGYKPLDVENFKCRSYNWENLKCSFEMPNNPVLAVYQLSYMPKLQSHTGSVIELRHFI